jgi:hypothetical protein
VIRWMIVVIVALVLFSAVAPFLRQFGIGRLPGDLNFKIGSKHFSIPLTSTILLSLVAMGISKLI